MKKTVWMIGLLLIGASGVWAASDHVQSLRGGVALDAPSAPTSEKEWYDGDGKINREYVQQPPLIPHAIEGFHINREGNACLNCHNWNSEMPGATKVGISHFSNRKNQALSQVSPRRYFCTQCHVPQRNAQPLVANIFKPLVEQ